MTFVTPWTAACHASLSITNSWSLLKLISIESVVPSNHLILYCPLLLLHSISQHQGFFQMSQFFASGGWVLKFQLQHQSFPCIFKTNCLQDGLVGSPCIPRNSRVSSPMPQSKSIDSSVLTFLYSPTLTSIRDYWKNNSVHWRDLCWESNVSTFFLI